MNLAKMAFKNLFRYKRRTFITVIAIGIALTFYIYMDSLMEGWYKGTEREYINYEVADGRIVRADWWADKDRKPLSLSIDNPNEISSLLDKLDIAYTMRTEFLADLVFYEDPFPTDGDLPTVVTAIDLSTDGEIFELIESMEFKESQGEFFKEGEEGIVIGNALAEKLGIEVGYSVRLQGSGRYQVPMILDATVVGIVKSNSLLTNLNGIFVPIDVADYYLEMEGAVTFFSIKTSPGRAGRKQLKELEKLLPSEYSLLGYSEIASDFMAAMRSEDGFLYLFLIVIAIIAAVGVSNTMMMAVFERRREIGMMRAQGLSEVKIAWMFFFEAMGIGILGAIVGLAMGALANIQMVYFGINYGAMMKSSGEAIDFGGIAFPSVLKGVWNLKAFLIAGIFSIVISFFAAIAPTIRMLRKSIPDNLKTN